MTASLLDSLSHDETVMKTLIDRAEDFLDQKHYEQAHNMFSEGYTHETWRDKFGSQMLVGMAHC